MLQATASQWHPDTVENRKIQQTRTRWETKLPYSVWGTGGSWTSCSWIN